MDLHHALMTGDLGLRLQLPPGKVLEVDQKFLRYFDDEHQVVVDIRLLPWRLDLSPTHEAPLYRDCIRDARAQFEEYFEPQPDNPFGTGQPRTADPAWSPLVELETLDLGGPRLLKSVRRLMYQAGSELIQGQLSVPVRDGTIEVSTLAKADQTGTKECILYVKLGRQPTQAEFDDPTLDETFTDHPLARVRAALSWFLSEGSLEVTEPDRLPAIEELELPGSRSVILPPPRFRLLDAAQFGMTPTLDILGRVALRVGVSPSLLDVFWMKDTPPPADLEGLEDLARANSEGWTSSGMSDIQVEVTGSSRRPDGLMLATRVAFRNQDGQPKVTLKRWRVFQDRVVRVAMSIPSWQPEHEAAAEIDLVAESWRPLD